MSDWENWKKKKAGEIHPVDIHVGRRLTSARNMLGLSQTEVARGLGVSFQQIQKYESGFNRISASRLYEVSQLTGQPVGWFFEGLGPEYAENRDEDVKLSEWKMLRAYRALPGAVRDAVSDFIRKMGNG